MDRAVGVVVVAAVVAVAVMLGTSAPRVVEAASVTVTSAADSGPGSFRQAVIDANGNSSITTIVLANWLPITLNDTVVYSGSQSLTVRGNNPVSNRVIRGPAACDLFRSTNGADLTFERVTLQESFCNGIEVLGGNGFGEIVVTLTRATLRDNDSSGVRMTENDPTDASFTLNVALSRLDGNGLNGAEILEWGDSGDVRATITGSSFDDNGYAGLVIDETYGGILTMQVTGSSFNGSSRGMRITETGTGDLDATLKGVQANDSWDEYGVQLTESDEGSILVNATSVETSRNEQVGFRVEEGGEGSVTASLLWMQANDNDIAGVLLFEFELGDVEVSLASSGARGNEIGFSFQELGEGDLATTAFGSNASENELGFSLGERDAGAFDARFLVTTSLFNEDGVEASAEGDPGTLDRTASPLLGPFVLTNVNLVP